MNESMVNSSGMGFPCQLPPFFPEALGIPEAVNIIQGCIATLSALVGLPMNIYLFAIIVKFPVLHQRSLFLSLQIILIEIIYHLLIPAAIMTSSIHGTWLFGKVFCSFASVIHDAFAMYRFTMTLVLTVDRFISVYQPFVYAKRGKIVAWTLSVIMWLITVIRVVLPLPGVLDCFVYIPTFKTCTLFPGCSESCKIFAAWSVGVVVSTGVIIPLILYCGIFLMVRKIRNYHKSITLSVRRNSAIHQERISQYDNLQKTRKKFVTVFILMVSIIGTVPAFTLYVASLFNKTPSAALLIVNMLVGRTSFNMIPVFDGIALTRHQDIRAVSSKLFKSLTKRKMLSRKGSFSCTKSQAAHSLEHSRSPSMLEPMRSFAD